MEKEIRMPYSEYKDLINEIETFKKYTKDINQCIEEKDNVLIFELTSTGYFGHRGVKILKLPDESYKLDEVFRENVQEKNDIIFDLRVVVDRLNRENDSLKSKIPWWRK